MTDIVPAQKGVVAFGRRNANEERIKQAEQELEELRNPPSEDKSKEEEDDSNLTAEERTFKKRYGDLRLYAQRQKEEFDQKIEQLQKQLDSAAKKEIKLPKTQDEIDAWAKQYPDVYKLVKTIAIQQAKEQTTGLEERMRKLDEKERDVSKSKAEAELMRLHPDFDQIREDDDFHDWVAEQPKWIQDALYENDTDARSAARAIDLYKADRNITSKKKPSAKDAAAAVNTRGSKAAPNGEGTEGLIYESQVDKMSASEYEKNIEAIQAAIQSGKFVYDMSGAAR